VEITLINFWSFGHNFGTRYANKSPNPKLEPKNGLLDWCLGPGKMATKAKTCPHYDIRNLKPKTKTKISIPN